MKKLSTYIVALCLLVGLTVDQFSLNASDTVYEKFETSLFVPNPNTASLKEKFFLYYSEKKLITSFKFKTIGVSNGQSKDYNEQIECILKVQKHISISYNSSIKKAIFLIQIFTSKYKLLHNIK